MTSLVAATVPCATALRPALLRIQPVNMVQRPAIKMSSSTFDRLDEDAARYVLLVSSRVEKEIVTF